MLCATAPATARHTALLLATCATAFIANIGCSTAVDPSASGISNAAIPTTLPTASPAAQSTPSTLSPNIELALKNLEAQPALAPSAVLVLDYLRRWYGFAAFPDLADRYRLAIRQGNAAGLPDDWQASYLRVMHRIITTSKIRTNKNARWEDFAGPMFARGGINVITVPALYCDQIPFPAEYASILAAGLVTGGYELTHVGMALRWIDENGCSSPMDADFEPTVAKAIAKLVDPADGVTDLEIEATAFLMYMDRRDLVHADAIDAIASAQRPNGGWSLDSSDKSLATRWHPTAMGVWALLGHHAPDVEMSPMIAPSGAAAVDEQS